MTTYPTALEHPNELLRLKRLATLPIGTKVRVISPLAPNVEGLVVRKQFSCLRGVLELRDGVRLHLPLDTMCLPLTEAA